MDPIPAAGVIIFNESGQILLVRRGHSPQQGRWSVPGGHLEPGESAADAAIREALEETGLQVRIEREVLNVRIPAGGGRQFDVHDFAATVIGGSLTPGDDATDAGWFSPHELLDLPLVTNLLADLQDAGIVPRQID